MNKKEVEGIEKVIKEYLKKNLRMESRVRYLVHDNIPGYPGYHISKRGKIYSRWDVNGKGILNKR